MDHRPLSLQWRQEGNTLHKNLPNLTPYPELTIARLQDVLQKFYRAIQTALCAKEYASGHKNYAATAFKLANILEIEARLVNKRMHYYKEALGHYVQALNHGSDVMGETWMKHLSGRFQCCILEVNEFINNLPWITVRKTRALEELIVVTEDHHLCAPLYLSHGKLLLKKSVAVLETSDYNNTLRLLQHCRSSIEKASSLAEGNQTILNLVDLLQEDINKQTWIAKSWQALQAGVDLFDEVMKQDEYLNIEKILQVIDMYKKAYILAKERDIELEAIALSRLGEMYHKILKERVQAKEFLEISLHLASTMYTECFRKPNWFENALEYLQEIQTAQEENEFDKSKISNRSQIEAFAALQLLRVLEKMNIFDMINRIYSAWKTHNPEIKTFTCEKEGPYELQKQMIINALQCYHPKNQYFDKSDKWKSLCGEISNALYRKYYQLKLEEEHLS